ncbi:hypothetical protein FHP88_15775 [Sedimenticola selenatireducens]|uniref:Uncharacterized protein n=1 Tax=Sedimenticola selenatireducens TaxID=191960 RepID=A0A557S0F0_9GAMM|nr:hypothetical protein [Sedimenticola selenatireducens]TVO70912.1 hypothetical protein FHP88_15775 [Sedimenticola selenatireducens]
MPTLTWPTSLRPSDMQWRLQTNTTGFTSPFTGKTTTQEWPGARWMATLVYDQWRRHEIQAMEAFLVALRGSAGRFYLWNHARENPLGAATGTPLVNGANQVGANLITDGWTPNQAGILLAGDYIGAGGELKMVIADVDADATGSATIPIEPPLRYSPTDDSAVIVNSPTTTFKLVDDEQTAFDYKGVLGGFSIDVIEAF